MPDYSQLSTDDLLALKQGDYGKVSTEGLKLIRGQGGSQFGQAADAGEVGTLASPRPYKGAPDLPLEGPLLDPVDLVAGGLSGMAGAKAGSALANGPLRSLLRYRLGSNPGQGFEKVAETVARTAPEALRPAEASAEGLSSVMRSGAGKAALRQSREEGFNPIYQELGQTAQANQNAAGQGLTGGYQARAMEAAADPASRFKRLVTELADANRGGFNPATGETRTAAGSLVPLRNKAEILDEIQGLLSPDQWARFQDLQKEYSRGSALLRLFKAPTSGARRGSGTDVLTDQAALQSRAKGMQEQIDPALLKSIFRGGMPLEMDKSATLPLGLARFGSIRLPGTIMAGPPSTLQDLLLQLLSGAGGAGFGMGAERGLSQ